MKVMYELEKEHVGHNDHDEHTMVMASKHRQIFSLLSGMKLDISSKAWPKHNLRFKITNRKFIRCLFLKELNLNLQIKINQFMKEFNRLSHMEIEKKLCLKELNRMKWMH